MFEDSLVESQDRIHTRSRWFAIGTSLAQAALLALLLLYPLLHPLALPKQSVERLLIAPPPPRAPTPVQVRRASAPASSHNQLPTLEAQLRVPTTIPHNISTVSDAAPPSNWVAGAGDGPAGGSVPGGLDLGPPPPAVKVTKPPARRTSLAVSSGVAAGQLLSPIRPAYPAIARQARIQGTVILEATISSQGTIENLQVVEGPPMLRQAAIEAVDAARYRPFLLNGEPVAVQTSIRVTFSLGQ